MDSIPGTDLPAAGALLELRLDDALLLELALRFYLLPLGLLLMATGVATALGAPEPAVMVAAVVALVSGFLCLQAGGLAAGLHQGKHAVSAPNQITFKMPELNTLKPNIESRSGVAR